MKYVNRLFAWPFVAIILIIGGFLAALKHLWTFTIHGGDLMINDINNDVSIPWSDEQIRTFVDRLDHLPPREDDEFTPLAERISSRYPFPIWHVRPLVKQLREAHDEYETEKIAAKVLVHADKYAVTIEDSYKALEILDELRA